LRGLLLIGLTLPFLISDIARAFDWLHILQALKLPLFGESAVLLVLVAGTLPFATFPVILALPPHNNNIWASCNDLGVSGFLRLSRVTIPLAAAGIAGAWLSVFGLVMGASVEASVVGGPMEISLARMIGEFQADGQFTAAYAVSVVVTFALVGLGLLGYVLSRVALHGTPTSRIPFRIEEGSLSRSKKPPLKPVKKRHLIRVLAVVSVAGLLLFVVAPIVSIFSLSLLGTGANRLEHGSSWYAQSLTSTSRMRKKSKNG
jgi:ABC-type Fe3+ transport system permease subunit